MCTQFSQFSPSFLTDVLSWHGRHRDTRTGRIRDGLESSARLPGADFVLATDTHIPGRATCPTRMTHTGPKYDLGATVNTGQRRHESGDGAHSPQSDGAVPRKREVPIAAIANGSRTEGSRPAHFQFNLMSLR